MWFILAITLLFVVISIYFFFRAEKMQRAVLIQKRDNAITRKESQVLIDSTAIIATKYEEFSKSRLTAMRASAQKDNNEQLLQYCETISPLINNYGLIFRECLKGKERLKPTCQKCFQNHDEQAFKNFVQLLMQSEKHLKRFWSHNNFNGFISLVEALLIYPDIHDKGVTQPNEKGVDMPLKDAVNQ